MTHFSFKQVRVLVVGDLMLDRYVDGSVSRLSPEAPVPVVLQRSERTVLGGAANVVGNIASLNARVSVVGTVGCDVAGTLLCSLLAGLSTVETAFIVHDAERATTCKTRIMSGLHQIVRVDTEVKDILSSGTEAAIIEAVRIAVRDVDIVVLSDYGKGVCSDAVIRTVIDEARAAGHPCLVDPKRADFSVYHGATMIKPNRAELTLATRHPCETNEEARAAAEIAIATTQAGILLTRSEHGMSFFQRGLEPLHLSTAARDVFDVSGAGDTVVAVAALGIGAKLPLMETMRLANIAAGIVVSRVGTSVVTTQDLETELDREAHGSSPGKGALVTRREAIRRRVDWEKRGLRVGFTNGCFDLLHPGHISLLQQAAEHCDRLIVGINSDESVRRLKGPSRPVQNESARSIVLGSLSVVDLVVIFEEDTPAEIIDSLQPDLLVKGGDYTIDTVVGADKVRARGGSVMLATHLKDNSTSNIVQRISSFQDS